MTNQPVSNPNDFKVVDFTNKTSFDFTPEMGCMFDSRPIFGTSGFNGIKSGESIKLPYHIGQRLAVNLAKASLTREAPKVDAAGIPTGVPLWDSVRIEAVKNSFIVDLYSEAKPIAESQVDILMRKVEELNRLVTEKVKPVDAVQPVANEVSTAKIDQPVTPTVYKDKQEVVAELTKRGIAFDARSSKAALEKLLA